ncbi:hypothetical protein [Frigoriflavimonas asaccharolytica]|uniref:Uncharacterized protein n=1 Tax=Frigoriflavimonas asaccharolytica TaxID=2735899 RepID=A0A8J8G5G3_9FLAO|nr:hypothetical protein [Frigoriflavimonas asaccharolytica]NRS91493.1 hypothetical protein [Frigoriflavimonas asaccharolytica]
MILIKYHQKLFTLLFLISCVLSCDYKSNNFKKETTLRKIEILEIPKKNISIIEAAKKYGPEVSSTYKKAVCTEFLIQILEKSENLTSLDKSRIRIITNDDIQDLLKNKSMIQKEYILL